MNLDRRKTKIIN
ncbi:hypothetical protein F383_01712 [Gossypium arboreum]|uniref:Uncharacterized protein n=1 Tax=Gossypium arboreum TaxID=29729 RepID=A0A0B0P880_GOSAR|nr:hypothetical protein F383_01712 [Gossypium arboreum]